MWTISEIKERGKAAFKANYWKCVLVALIMGLFAGTSGRSASTAGQNTSGTIDVNSVTNGMSSSELLAVAAVVASAVLIIVAVAALLKIFLFNPLEIGGCAFFRENTIEPGADLSFIGMGFRNYWHNFVTLFLRDLYLLLWTMLLIVPGIIKAYSYRMVPYILTDHPELTPNEVITRSREMMDGNKWQSFLLDLSFIGWIVLGIVTLGLGLVFWTAPYMQSSNAALYLKLSGEEA